MEILEKSYGFLKEKKHVSLATSFEGRPHIRVFEIMDIQNGKIFFATSPKKEVWTQLLKNPQIEILSFDANTSVRVEGKVHTLDEDEKCKELYEMKQNIIFRQLYSDFKDLVYFYLPIDKLTFFDLTCRPPFMKVYDKIV